MAASAIAVAGSEAGKPAPIRRRLAALDWAAIGRSLDAWGYAKTPAVLTPAECGALVGLYERDGLFRSRVEMGGHGFGEGDYKYFSAPLPPLVRDLREAAYPPLAAIANRWSTALGSERRYPAGLGGFLAECAARGQTKPTPLLLHYEAGGFNCLHQDLYGDVAFPLQLAAFLSRPGLDFEGGEFLLVEQRPRAQSRGEAILPAQGELVIFAVRERPAAGRRGFFRVSLRHGVSRVRRGRRFTLGVIFHDAR